MGNGGVPLPMIQSVSKPLFRGGIVGAHLTPVYDIPESADIIRAPVLVMEIVGMLPYVDAEDRRIAFHIRTVLIGRAIHVEIALTVYYQIGGTASNGIGGSCESRTFNVSAHP